MNRTAYKNSFNKKHYERISLSVPKGMKDVIKELALQKNLTMNAYLLSLVIKDQEGMFDTMQIAEKNRQHIMQIKGNMHDGYDVTFMDGHTGHCRTKKDVRNYIIKYLAQDKQSLTQYT